jgi:hypothetical protein
MKKITATLIAGLFATAAFAQTPATSTTKPVVHADSKTAVLVSNKDMKAGAAADTKVVTQSVKTETMPTAVVKAETKDVKTAVKADTKTTKTTTKAKTKAHKAEAKAAPEAEATTSVSDTQGTQVDTTAATPAMPATPATPAMPASAGMPATPATPAMPATPATPAMPATTTN